jgi:hypothetical protein
MRKLKLRMSGIVCSTFLCARECIGLCSRKGEILVNVLNKMWVFTASFFLNTTFPAGKECYHRNSRNYKVMYNPVFLNLFSPADTM